MNGILAQRKQEIDPLDKFDNKIIALLVENARQSISDIAREVSLSRSAVSDRIKQLEKSGLIKGYHADIAQTVASNQELVRAYFELQYSERNCDRVIEEMRLIPEVKQCHTISGQVDMLVYIEAPSMSRLEQIRKHLELQEKMMMVRTHMILREGFKR